MQHGFAITQCDAFFKSRGAREAHLPFASKNERYLSLRPLHLAFPCTFLPLKIEIVVRIVPDTAPQQPPLVPIHEMFLSRLEKELVALPAILSAEDGPKETIFQDELLALASILFLKNSLLRGQEERDRQKQAS